MLNPSKGQENDEPRDLAQAAAEADPPSDVAPAPRIAPIALEYRALSVSGPTSFDERKFKDLHLPLALLCGGVAVEILAELLTTRTIESAVRRVGVELIAGTFLMSIGIRLVARARGIELGRFWPVTLKLAALTVGPSALVRLAWPEPLVIRLGWIVGWPVECLFSFILLGLFFDLDQSDTWYCVCAVFVVRLVVYLLMPAVA